MRQPVLSTLIFVLVVFSLHISIVNDVALHLIHGLVILEALALEAYGCSFDKKEFIGE